LLNTIIFLHSLVAVAGLETMLLRPIFVFRFGAKR